MHFFSSVCTSAVPGKTPQGRERLEWPSMCALERLYGTGVWLRMTEELRIFSLGNEGDCDWLAYASLIGEDVSPKLSRMGIINPPLGQ